MRRVIVAWVLSVVLSPLAVRAGEPATFGTVRSATIDPRTGAAVPAVTRLQPVVGTVQPAHRFGALFGHSPKYSSMVYNPTLGTFGTQKFRLRR